MIWILCFLAIATADLRMGSQPRNGYKLRQYSRRRSEKFVIATTTNSSGRTPTDEQGKVLYMEPSTFGYKGLERQKRNNYDNFLRSNIDNEQDNRNFRTEAGKDHLPFRTLEANAETKYTENGQNVDLPITVYPGESKLIPLRWNNPHASELEVNIWLLGYDVVVPIKRPSCSGEGEQNNVVEFTVPDDFRGEWTKLVQANGKTFTGCNTPTDCVVQFYAHSVESRTYSTAVPIIIPDPTGIDYVKKAPLDTEPVEPTDPYVGPPAADATKIYAATTRLGAANPLTSQSTTVNSGRVYLYIMPDILVDKAVFTITGGGTNLEKVENRPPFEFKTTGLSADEIGSGVKDVSVELTFYDGTKETITGKFSVEAPSGRRLLVANSIKEVDEDPWLDLSKLKRDTCLPANDLWVDIRTAQPKKARLVSDVYNHAYQNSNFSPYSGQQQNDISRNMQAACIIHMVSGNRGELGKNALPRDTRRLQNDLNQQVNKLYKQYEKVANKIIDSIGKEMDTTGIVGDQPLRSCFRCAEKGSTSDRRLKTTTYVPSFKIEDEALLAKAKTITAEQGGKYERLISSSNVVQIYVATLYDMLPYFNDAATKGLTYLPAKLKNTITTMDDPTEFKKVKADGSRDNGEYAASQAKFSFHENCPEKCFYCAEDEEALTQALIKGSKGTCVTYCSGDTCQSSGATDCTGCARFFTNEPRSSSAAVDKSSMVEENIAFQEVTLVEELKENAVGADPSGQCMTESVVDEVTGEETPGVPIPGMCEDGPCDNDDPEHLCKCGDLDQVDEVMQCVSGAASSAPYLLLLGGLMLFL